MSNQVTSYLADVHNWYKSLGWFKKFLVNLHGIGKIYARAYCEGWNAAQFLAEGQNTKNNRQCYEIAALADRVEALATRSNYIEAHNIAVMIRQLRT